MNKVRRALRRFKRDIAYYEAYHAELLARLTYLSQAEKTEETHGTEASRLFVIRA